jgi:D-serine deaminase-like pyridoxal phosphate-dependent protein
MEKTDWYLINNITEIDSPALVVYPDRIKANIALAIQMIGNVDALRPHVKTHKMAEVCQLMLDAGITKFKCATIAEAEMLAQVKAPDVLLAYQPVGPKAERLVTLIKKYPGTKFSCLVDNKDTATALSALMTSQQLSLPVYLDLNIGMNRTGILPGEEAAALFTHCLGLPGIQPVGLHAYDGHIKEVDLAIRQQQSDAIFAKAQALRETIEQQHKLRLLLIIGGSPTYSTHVHRADVECSPGTFVFWDWSYQQQLPEQSFKLAALVITRVISILDQQTICVDLGHKSVAAENPHPRIYFLNAPDVISVGQSEEHLVLKVADASKFKIGDVFYGTPFHICPTVALYEKAWVVNNGRIDTSWKVIARDRKITV